MKLSIDKQLANTVPLSLSGIEDQGYGVQAQPGATGFGMPTLDHQFLATGRSGSVLRSSRFESRRMSIPLVIMGRTVSETISLYRDLSRTISGRFTIIAQDSLGKTWEAANCVLVGQGDYQAGVDYIDNGREIKTEITIQSESPFFEGYGVSGSFTETIGLAGTTSGSLIVPGTGDAPWFPEFGVGLSFDTVLTVSIAGYGTFKYKAGPAGGTYGFLMRYQSITGASDAYAGLDPVSNFPMAPPFDDGVPITYTSSKPLFSDLLVSGTKQTLVIV